MIQYSYNRKNGILETRGTGIVTINEIAEYYENIYQDDSLPENLRNIIDSRENAFNIKATEPFSHFKSIVKKLVSRYKSIKEAIIVDNPSATVIAMLYEKHTAGIKSYEFNVFSTKEGALNWLMKS